MLTGTRHQGRDLRGSQTQSAIVVGVSRLVRNVMLGGTDRRNNKNPQGRIISSFELSGKDPLYYYTDVNVLSCEAGREDLLAASKDFGPALFRLFRGLRKLRALKMAQLPPDQLFVEPWRTCNLACTYCYAKAGPQFKKRLSVDTVVSLDNKYSFSSMTVLGGDPLIDKQFLTTLIGLKKQWKSFLFSTNGLLMDPAFHSQVVGVPFLGVQISIEPPEWSNRINIEGTKQFDLVRDKMNLFTGSNFSFAVTFPSDVPYVPLRSFLDSLESLTGTDNFSVSYWPGNGYDLPVWFDRWIEETYEMIQEGVNKRKLLGYSHAPDMFSDEGPRMFFCNAGVGGVAIGPDNKLHACHEHAILEEPDDIISSSDAEEGLKVDVGKLQNLVYRWTCNMDSEVCTNCSMRFVCGGLCYNWNTPNAGCVYLSRASSLLLTELNMFNGDKVADAISRTGKTFEGLYAIRDEIARDVAGEKWVRLLSGSLPLSDAVEMANAYFK